MAQATTDSSFYVTCMSNKCREFFPNNKTSSFSTKLRSPIALKNGEWEVGVSSFIYQQAINNFGETLLMEMMVYDGNNIHTISFPDVHVSTPEDVVAQLESALKQYSERHNFRVVSMIVDKPETDEDREIASGSRKRKREIFLNDDPAVSVSPIMSSVIEDDILDEQLIPTKKTKSDPVLQLDPLIESFMTELLAAILTIEHINDSSNDWDRLYHLVHCVKINTSIHSSWTKISRMLSMYFPDQFSTLSSFFIYRFIPENYEDNAEYLSIVDIAGAIFNYSIYLSDLLTNQMIIEQSSLISVINELK